MSKQQSVFKKHLITFVESLNPEAEKDYLNFSKSKNRVEKIIQIYDDSIRFNKMMAVMFSPEAIENNHFSGQETADVILNILIERLLHDVACLNEF